MTSRYWRPCIVQNESKFVPTTDKEDSMDEDQQAIRVGAKVDAPSAYEAPRIETVLVENPETPASGCGEPPIVTIGAVLANAIYDAVGVRMFDVPMTPDRILRAIEEKKRATK